MYTYVLPVNLGIIRAGRNDIAMRGIIYRVNCCGKISLFCLKRKQYNRTIRTHKMHFEVLWYLLMEKGELENV